MAPMTAPSARPSTTTRTIDHPAVAVTAAAMRSSEPAPSSRVIAIASGKGGVGKTWFSVSAACLLARAGQRVLLFDGDLGLANVDIQLGLLPERDLASFISRDVPLEEAVTHYGTEPGQRFDVLAGRSGAGTLASMDARSLERLLDGMRRASQYDTVLLDLGAGIDPAMRRLAASADLSLVLATDEPTSLTDAYAVLTLLDRDHRHLRRGAAADARIVVNQASTLGSGEKTHAILARACRTFLGKEPPLAGVIRRDEKVKDAIRHQVPLPVRHPGSIAARDMQRVLTSLG